MVRELMDRGVAVNLFVGFITLKQLQSRIRRAEVRQCGLLPLPREAEVVEEVVNTGVELPLPVTSLVLHQLFRRKLEIAIVVVLFISVV